MSSPARSRARVDRSRSLTRGRLSFRPLSSRRCYSEASDAFSFGVVLYEMFARSPPWEGHENLDVAFRVCSGERMAVSNGRDSGRT